MGRIEVVLTPPAPFRLDLTVWALRRRSHNLVDQWEGGVFQRAFDLGNSPARVSISQVGSRIHVQAACASSLAGRKDRLIEDLRRILGLDADLSGFYAMAEKDSRLRPLYRRFLGVKPPQFPTVFEALLNGISCQQLSLTVGITLLNRLAARYGKSIAEGLSLFPGPEVVSAARPADLQRLGYSRAKAQAILSAAARQASGGLDLESLRRMDDADAMETLLSLPGIGPWTAGYVLLRGLGRLNVFPGGDVGAQNNLVRFLRLRKRPAEAKLSRILERWRPYAGLVYFHLLLDRLRLSGVVV